MVKIIKHFRRDHHRTQTRTVAVHWSWSSCLRAPTFCFHCASIVNDFITQIHSVIEINRHVIHCKVMWKDDSIIYSWNSWTKSIPSLSSNLLSRECVSNYRTCSYSLMHHQRPETETKRCATESLKFITTLSLKLFLVLVVAGEKLQLFFTPRRRRFLKS